MLKPSPLVEPSLYDGDLEMGKKWRIGDWMQFNSMNDELAKRCFSTEQQVREFLELALSHYDEAHALNGIYQAFVYWEGKPNAPALAAILGKFCFEEQTGLKHQLSLDEVQAHLELKDRTGLWSGLIDFLVNEGKSLEDAELRRRVLVMQASLARRAGELDKASAALSEVVSEHRESGEGNGDRALLLYELGYVNFLRGDRLASVQYLSDSADVAFQAGDETGGWISLCVEYYFRYLWGMSDSDLVLNILRSGREKFMALDNESNPRRRRAQRWVASVWTLEVEVKGCVGEFAGTAEAIAGLRERRAEWPNADWFLLLFEGIVSYLSGKHETAIEQFREYIKGFEDRGDGYFALIESPSRAYLFLGRSYVSSGNVEEACRWLQAGAALGLAPGNHVWIERIASELRALKIM
ncbi:MAG: hypothetical protein KDN22_02955 [Verrucomicrobiae bacterium]|nr:hypothetical protein [Verrucomicrobiae bacterium]